MCSLLKRYLVIVIIRMLSKIKILKNNLYNYLKFQCNFRKLMSKVNNSNLIDLLNLYKLNNIQKGMLLSIFHRKELNFKSITNNIQN